MTGAAGPRRAPTARPTPGPIGRTLWAGLLVGLGPAARGQDFEKVQEAPVAANRFQLDESVFNSWIFGKQNRSVPAQDYLDLLLGLRVAEVEQTCSLSDAQKRKLVLAGHGDIKRFVDRIAQAREVFDRLRTDQNRMNEIYQQTQPLAEALAAGLFGDGSVFAKTLGSTLSPEQQARACEVQRLRIQARYKARVLLALARLDTMVGFTSEQYRRYAELILAATTPPSKPAGPLEAQLVLFKIAAVPADKVQPLFDEAQWKLLAPLLRQARRPERLLREQGLIEAGEAAPTADTRPNP